MRFRTWADTFPVVERSGEWECLYADWQTIYNAFGAYINATVCQEWDEAMMQTLLYIVARDNEMQKLVKQVARNPENLLCLGEYALVSPERDAKWQLADELGHADRHTPQVEALLLQFAHDPDEYVRRRSLVALANIGSSRVEALAASAWETGDEYQRMAALFALWKAGSPQLEIYLTRADADGRRYLGAYAVRVRSGNPE